MAGSIFNYLNSGNKANGLVQQVNQIKSLLRGNNAEQVAMNLMQRNPQFNQFLNQCKGKSVEEICSMYGLDIDSVKSALSSK